MISIFFSLVLYFGSLYTLHTPWRDLTSRLFARSIFYTPDYTYHTASLLLYLSFFLPAHIYLLMFLSILMYMLSYAVRSPSSPRMDDNFLFMVKN